MLRGLRCSNVGGVVGTMTVCIGDLEESKTREKLGKRQRYQRPQPGEGVDLLLETHVLVYPSERAYYQLFVRYSLHV